MTTILINDNALLCCFEAYSFNPKKYTSNLTCNDCVLTLALPALPDEPPGLKYHRHSQYRKRGKLLATAVTMYVQCDIITCTNVVKP